VGIDALITTLIANLGAIAALWLRIENRFSKHSEQIAALQAINERRRQKIQVAVERRAQ
jgi:hypothetical protein